MRWTAWWTALLSLETSREEDGLGCAPSLRIADEVELCVDEVVVSIAKRKMLSGEQPKRDPSKLPNSISHRSRHVFPCLPLGPLPLAPPESTTANRRPLPDQSQRCARPQISLAHRSLVFPFLSPSRR